MKRLVASLMLGGALAACSSSEEPPPTLSAADLQDPQKCQTCHPDHYKEWSGSMHAYASDDPVFRAMNARGQRETGGKLGDFCVKCHAPLAVASGATKDGTNLDGLPANVKGVTCFFCHSAAAVNDTHNNPITLATDGVLRAGIQDPVHNTAHVAGYSPILDRETLDSAKTCGACHDIVAPPGGQVERTFQEWQGTVFSHPPIQLACGECHMDGRDGLAAQAPGVALRRVHSHLFPGVDLAITDFVEKDAQKAAVQKFLDTTLQAALCVKGVGQDGLAQIQVVLDNVGAGHSWPSGAAQDRRAWVEVIASAKGKVVYQSGVVADGDDVTKSTDPDIWLLRDCLFDGGDKEVNMFWDAASFESNLLPGPVTKDPADPKFYLTHIVRSFPRSTSMPPKLATAPDHVTMRVRLLPIGLDVLGDLVTTKDLDAKYLSAMPVYTLGGTDLDWTDAKATIKYPDQGLMVSCVSKGLTTGANFANAAVEHVKCGP